MSAANPTADPTAVSITEPPHGTRAWLAVVRVYNLCDAVLAERLGALGLRVVEHEVLVNLLRAPGLTQQDLAQRCFVAKSGVSMLVGQMEKQGRVTRQSDPVDARVKRLLLTPEGEALARQALAVQSEVVRTMVGSVSDTDLDTVAELMQGVAGRLEALLK
jgi:DNA-binding MarR family transcriptional regulator